jgi:hypothetical protein
MHIVKSKICRLQKTTSNMASTENADRGGEAIHLSSACIARASHIRV